MPGTTVDGQRNRMMLWSEVKLKNDCWSRRRAKNLTTEFRKHESFVLIPDWSGIDDFDAFNDVNPMLQLFVE
jgi:hypothetical protein